MAGRPGMATPSPAPRSTCVGTLESASGFLVCSILDLSLFTATIVPITTTIVPIYCYYCPYLLLLGPSKPITATIVPIYYYCPYLLLLSLFLIDTVGDAHTRKGKCMTETESHEWTIQYTTNTNDNDTESCLVLELGGATQAPALCHRPAPPHTPEC